MSLTITKAEHDRICKGKTCGENFAFPGEESTKCPIYHSCNKKIKKKLSKSCAQSNQNEAEQK